MCTHLHVLASIGSVKCNGSHPSDRAALCPGPAAWLENPCVLKYPGPPIILNFWLPLYSARELLYRRKGENLSGVPHISALPLGCFFLPTDVPRITPAVGLLISFFQPIFFVVLPPFLKQFCLIYVLQLVDIYIQRGYIFLTITMPGSPYLNCRCAVSTFIKNAQPLLDVLSEESKNILNEARILPLFSIPKIPQNIPLLYILVRIYNRKQQAFLLGNVYVSLTVNEIAMILGLPNRGVEFSFVRRPFARYTQKNMIEELNGLVNEELSPTLENRRVDLLVRYMLAVFLFPQMGLKIPKSVLAIEGLEMFTKYNWPLAIHKHLHAQIADLNAKSVLRDPGENLGYFEGCSVVLLVWIYEHTNLQPVVDFIARPRICRWSSKLSYSSKVCFNLPRTLQLPDQVRKKKKFVEFNIDEYERIEEERVERRSRRREERKFLRRVKREKEEFLRVAEGLRGMENRVMSAVQILSQEVCSLTDLCMSWFGQPSDRPQRAPAHFPNPFPEPSTINPTPLSTVEVTLVDTTPPSTKKRYKKNEQGTPKQVKLKFEESYPGKALITARQREIIEFVLNGSQEDMQYYKMCKVNNCETLVSHITEQNVGKADLILMPVHVPSHWCLLVCDLKRCVWNFYDSMPRARHQSSLPGLIRAFHDDCRAALPSNILDWKIEDVPGIPKQANGFDCGVFVLKYMETTLSPKEVSWASTKGWHSNMPRYRAEITAEILRIFHDLVLKNIDNLET
ncbi:Ubiquitin-like-specific protease 1A [Platanthera zijinensis]|uniref:Ubiquitin-like-specific protease 1A n=1 Tax=Platanthera zijinensis TaxID=2320716 RepID=A0AAP0BFN5_9ASPA